MKLISMSVWGDQLMYWEGALANAQLLQSQYPGWQLRIYTDVENPLTQKLRDYGCEVRLVENRGGYHGAFWRFYPVSEAGVEAVIIRDADSRLNSREAAAVAAWLQSGRAAHVMRDYPHHYSWPMLGGMWGVRGGVIPTIEQKIIAWGRWGRKLDDQYFLKDVIWPLIADNCLQHVSGYSRWGGEPFPAHEPCDSDFVGQRYHAGGLKDVSGPAPSAERELRLLLASAKPCHTPEDQAVLRQLLAEGVDWGLFARTAVDHDLVPVAAHNLTRLADDLLPADILDAFRSAQSDASTKNRASLGELAGIIESLATSGVEAILLDSPVTGEPAVGIVREIVLLIRGPDLAPSTAALRRFGGQIPVALCARLTTGNMAVDIDYTGLWQRARRTDFFGRTISVLAPEDALLALAVRGGEQRWSKIKQVYEFSTFVDSSASLNWSVVVGRARTQGCLRLLLLATSLAGRCFGVALPDVLTVAEREDPLVKRIAERIVARWAHPAMDAPPDSAATPSMDELRLQDGAVRQIRYAVRALCSAAAINQARAFLRSSLARGYAKLRAQVTRVHDRLLGVWFTPAVGTGSAKPKLTMAIRRRARAQAEAALARDPDSAKAWCNLGDALSNLERYAEAVACYDKALALAPSAGAEHKRTTAMEGVIRVASSGRN